MAAYTLTLTEQDCAAIAFVGGRYSWSEALRGLEPGLNELTEAEAWEIRDAMDADDAWLPLLNPRSALGQKLAAFYDAII